MGKSGRQAPPEGSGNLTKSYYRIGEVSAITGIPESTLRFWESRVGAVKPRRGTGGLRLYTPRDVEDLQILHYLVHDRGLRLDAAEEQLRSARSGGDPRPEALLHLRRLRASLQLLLDSLG